MDKRTFLKNMTMLSMAGIPSIDAIAKMVGNVSHLPSEVVAKDEDFWAGIRGGYKLKPDYINLENGYYCFMPEETLEKFVGHVREVNYQGSYYMRTVQWDNKKAVGARLAKLAGCPPEELIITRNTTESLDMVIGGLPWNVGGSLQTRSKPVRSSEQGGIRTQSSKVR
jgi:hypothetical protein